jgi:hypothetical protein
VRRADESEVDQDRVPPVEEHILRLDVAVNQPAGVECHQRVGDADANTQRVHDGEAAAGANACPQRGPVDPGHHEVAQGAIERPRREERYDVRVPQGGEGIDLEL